MHFENRFNQTMTIEKNILPDVTYQLSDIKIRKENYYSSGVNC